MQAVIETGQFIRDARRLGLSDDERLEIVNRLAENPTLGDLMPGTGGARKVRFAGRGKGKSGGYRVITYYAAADVPVFLLAMISKGERTDMSKAEKNTLRAELTEIAENYRTMMRAGIRDIRRRQR